MSRSDGKDSEPTSSSHRKRSDSFERGAAKKKKFSCWVQKDDELLDFIEENEYRIYVHHEILEWIVSIIEDKILNDDLRATVKNVYHHDLEGDVFLIKFYQHTRISSLKNNNDIAEFRNTLTTIKNELKYKMAWRTNPTYFLRLDSKFNKRRIQIERELRQLNLHKSIIVTQLEVRWLYIPNIQIYEFSEYLSSEQILNIDSIFERKSKSQASIYICEQFEWHQEMHNFINMDTLAMDICAEEWRRFDLLKNFGLADILNLELANKDYRDSFYNNYLFKYLDMLLKKSLPQLYSNDDEKLEVCVNHLSNAHRHYFVSKFYDKLAFVFAKKSYNYPLTVYDIPIIKRKKFEIRLEGDRPPPEKLLNTNSHVIKYTISNYTHFSDSLFRALLDKTNECQTYHIKFDKGFTFVYDNIRPFAENLVIDCIWRFGYKKICFELDHCIESNSESLANFVKYIFKVFKEGQKLKIEVALSFTDCILDDYSFLNSIENYICEVRFQRMNFSSQQLSVLSQALGHHRRPVDFVDCKHITDNNVMTLLKNIEFDDLSIEGENSCTPLVYYLAAEYLMGKECVDTIKGTRFYHNMKDCSEEFNCFDFDQVDFKLVETDNGDKIIVRNRHSGQPLDLYYYINQLGEDKSFLGE